MITFNRSNSLQSLLFATALPFILLAVGAMSANAGTVTVTGATGAAGAPGKPGGAGGSATATATSSDPSNSATATGGNGGNGGPGIGSPPAYNYALPGRGGAGGAAGSTAIASNPNGAASATATSTGGNGGRGGLPNFCIHWCFGGHGGAGGAASAVSSATGGGKYTVASGATAHGGAGGFYGGADGHASAGASALSTGPGQVEADASASSWGGGASVTASAQNQSSSILTTAAVPPGSRASYNAVAESVAVGSAPAPVAAISAGQAVSNAALTPGGGLTIGIGAMSAGYVLSTAATYQTTAVFNFTARSAGALDLDLLSYKIPNVSGTDFDSLELQVVASDETTKTYHFNSLTGAEAFFTAHPIDLGNVAAGSRQSVSLLYELNYNAGTLAAAGDGFGFTYKLVDPPAPTTIPEPSTWAMMLIGFAGLAFAGYRASRRTRGRQVNVT